MISVAAALAIPLIFVVMEANANNMEMFELPLRVEGDKPEGRILHTLTAISGDRALLVGGLNESSDGTVAVADSVYLLTFYDSNETEPWCEWSVR